MQYTYFAQPDSQPINPPKSFSAPQVRASDLRIWDILPELFAAFGWYRSECKRGYLAPLIASHYRRLALVVVDGLGLNQLRARRGHIPFLRQYLEIVPQHLQKDLYTCAPSTTVAALTSLNTGLIPGQTGMLGYECFDPVNNQVLNLINFKSQVPVRSEDWSSQPTFFTLARQLGITQQIFSREKFRGSSLSKITLRDGGYTVTENWEERITAVARAFSEGLQYAYIYVPEIDHLGHKTGWESEAWTGAVEQLDLSLRNLREALPDDVLIVVTADHGMVNVTPETTVDLSKTELAKEIVGIAGEPRHLQIRLSTELKADIATGKTTLDQVIVRWQQWVGERAWVVSPREFLGMSQRYKARLGEMSVVAAGQWQFVHTGFHSPGVLEMRGAHGSITADEMAIPLLLI